MLNEHFHQFNNRNRFVNIRYDGNADKQLNHPKLHIKISHYRSHEFTELIKLNEMWVHFAAISC